MRANLVWFKSMHDCQSAIDPMPGRHTIHETGIRRLLSFGVRSSAIAYIYRNLDATRLARDFICAALINPDFLIEMVSMAAVPNRSKSATGPAFAGDKGLPSVYPHPATMTAI